MHDISLHGGTLSGAQVPRSSLLESRWLGSLLWLVLATSSIVFIEPAPYDLLAIGIACVLFCTGLSVPRSLGPAALLLALFLIGNLVGSLAGGYDATGLRSLSIRIYMVLAFLLFACLIAQNPRYFVSIIWSGYIVAAFVAVSWAIAQYYGYLPGEAGGPDRRATAGFKDANVFGPFLVPVALFLIAQLFRGRGAMVALTLGYFVFVMLGIFLAFSRGAWLNFLASFGFLSVLLVVGTAPYRQKLRFMLLLIVLGLAGFAALFWVVNYTAAGALFSARASLIQKYDIAAGGRFATQAEALESIGQTPFGIGPGMAGPTIGLEPHNIFLQLTLEAGWLGGLSMAALLLLSVWRGVRRLGKMGGELKIHLLVVLAALLGVLIQSFFIDSTHWRHFWLLLAMLWGLTAVPPRAAAKAH